VTVLGVLEEAEPEPMSVLVPEAEPVVEPVPEAPMEVPLPVEPVVPEPLAVVSVLLPVVPVVPAVVPLVPLVPIEPEPVLPAVVLLVSLGEVVVDGVVVEVEEEVEAASSRLPQALRDRAAIRARAAQRAMGDLIIRTLLEDFVSNRIEEDGQRSCCLRPL
jgi:hypothetical protein